MSDNQSTLLLQVGGGVASVRFNRGYAMNALSPQLLEELAEALESLHDRPDVQVVVLEGMGRAFSVGFDLRAMASLLNEDGSLDVDAVQRSAALGERVIKAVQRQRAVTVASAHGFAVGGGFLMLAACDLRIATHDLVCSVPEVAHFIHRQVTEDERDTATGELVATLLDKPKEALLQMKGQLQDASGIETSSSMPDPERLQLCATHPAFVPTLMAYVQRLRG